MPSAVVTPSRVDARLISARFACRQSPTPPTLFVQPTALPRAAQIEWQVAMHTGRPARPRVVDLDDDSEDAPVPPPVYARSDGASARGGEWSEVVSEEGEARSGAAGLHATGALRGSFGA